ncbi:cytochrome P40 monooxygenase [Diaporthe helianthi]|uniref:Cytochrome P40 monooxygenase n=1 Tax=Diaporthe helianthi TaxID=158607 RepID=A0A2P5HP23_DIAHE|nr:cytochrome P40 monooxygenase [Diaporthe helianthi]
MQDLHRKYDVVRIGPNWLSFNTAQAYMDVYTRPSNGKKAFLKIAEYERPGDIATIRDPDLHAVQKRALSKGFSPAAMRDQEQVLQEYLRLLFHQLTSLGKEGQVPVSIGEALNWFTLDIIGDLAFGESFKSCSEASNEACSLIADTLRYNNVEYLKRQQPWIGPVVAKLLFPPSLKDSHAKYQQVTGAKAAKRLLRADLDRQDFFSHLIRDGRIVEKELMATAWTLIMAGSETTATALTATIYYLLRNPHTLEKLTSEILQNFHHADEITGESVVGLQYLGGVIEEGLRLFPPLALGLPRESPGAVVDGHFIPQGTCVSVENFSMSYDPRYWENPECFRPERWLSGAGAGDLSQGGGGGDDKSAHHPFSEGTRSCIGKNLAYLELRILLASMVFCFEWELVSTEIEDWNSACECFALWTMPKLMVKLRPRGKELVSV